MQHMNAASDCYAILKQRHFYVKEEHKKTRYAKEQNGYGKEQNGYVNVRCGIRFSKNI